MQRANPVEMREALVAVEAMKHCGILFVPMPVVDGEDKEQLQAICKHRLNVIESKIAQNEDSGGGNNGT